MELFIRQGYNATTVDQIAAAAVGLEGSFFNRFPGEEDLTHAWIDRRRRGTPRPDHRDDRPGCRHPHPDGLKAMAALYDTDDATRRVMVRTSIRCGGPFGPDHGQTEEFIRALLDDGKSAGRMHNDLDTSVAGSVLQDVFSEALCRWTAAKAELP